MIYSYVLRYDDGAAPNPFWDVCTLAICKPAIRRKAKAGSWIIGTGSSRSRCGDGKTYDFSGMLVYAMKVDEVKTLEEYDACCREGLANKIPDKASRDWRLRLGDAIYYYSVGAEPAQREGRHHEGDRKRDLGGKNALLSRHFYYFGENPVLLPPQFQNLVKKNQGHKICTDKELIGEFENWLASLGPRGVRALPQGHRSSDGMMAFAEPSGCVSGCSTEKRIKKYGSDCSIQGN